VTGKMKSVSSKRLPLSPRKSTFTGHLKIEKNLEILGFSVRRGNYHEELKRENKHQS